MMKQGLKYFTDTDLTALGLILFLAVFVGVILWTRYVSKQGIYSEIEKLPLGGD